MYAKTTRLEVSRIIPINNCCKYKYLEIKVRNDGGSLNGTIEVRRILWKYQLDDKYDGVKRMKNKRTKDPSSI